MASRQLWAIGPSRKLGSLCKYIHTHIIITHMYIHTLCMFEICSIPKCKNVKLRNYKLQNSICNVGLNIVFNTYVKPTSLCKYTDTLQSNTYIHK